MCMLTKITTDRKKNQPVMQTRAGIAQLLHASRFILAGQSIYASNEVNNDRATYHKLTSSVRYTNLIIFS